MRRLFIFKIQCQRQYHGWRCVANDLCGHLIFDYVIFYREMDHFNFNEVHLRAWLSVIYLITMGSLAGYSAYIWLLQVRSATQVSTNAYVNPVVAVLLGVFFGGEIINGLQVGALTIILSSVFIINFDKYKKASDKMMDE